MNAHDEHRNERSVAIIGLGLIGGSFAKAYADAGIKVYGFDIDERTLQASMAEGTVCGPVTRDSLAQCSLVIVALYPSATIDWITNNAACISSGAMVLDCGGIKRAICEPCFEIAKEYGFAFVGGHPMAGTHHSGYRHARGDLFAGQPMVLVLPPDAEDTLESRICFELEPVGFASYSVTTAENHDRIIAYTSQLAHIVSSSFAMSPTAMDHKGFSAGSYRDLTRVAELNPDMWTELFLANSDFLADEIKRMIDTLNSYHDALVSGDGQTLRSLLAQGSQAKLTADGRFSESQVR